MTTEEKRKIIEDAGFKVHDALGHTMFYALLCYKNGRRETLEYLRDGLAKVLTDIDAALALYDEQDAKK